MTMAVWEILIFGVVSSYLLYGVVRTALWTEAKELKHFAEISRLERWQTSLRRNLIFLCVGVLLLITWKDIEFGWVWLVFGVVLVVLGLASTAGYFLKKPLLKAGFEPKPPTVSELKTNVGKMKRLSILFLCLLGLWVYSWIQKVI
jgi:hypothetical protein